MPNDPKSPPPPPPSETPPSDPNEGPGKGKAFFDRARTVAATGNFDFAINMYIEGLFREPFNVEEHKALREVSFKRKLGGAKSNGGGFLSGLGLGGLKLPYPKGKSAKEAMLNSEFSLSMDVGNINAMMAILRNADALKLVDVIMWIGPMIKEANRTNKQPKVEIFVELGDTYAKHDEFERACDALNSAFQLKPTDMELKSKADTYAAQATIKRGKYDKGGDFKASIKDVEKTKELLQEENLGKSEEYRLKLLTEAKAAYEANSKEMQVINKYSKALIDMETEEHENIAVDVLRKAYEETRIYRFKATIDDIQMRQRKRNMRIVKEAFKANPQDKDLLHQLEHLNKERIAFELKVFQERSEHMPTDMMVKYELGCRYYESKRFDEAIVAFQEAQSNPKHRVEALHLLGRSFLIQSMKPEAVETLKRAIDEYDLASTGDKKSKELHYWYARALEENKNIEEAKSVYSKVIQWEMGYLDARKRLDNLRRPDHVIFSAVSLSTTLGLDASFGFGDRSGLATAGHVAALKEAGGSIKPIFAQQSIREMQRTSRSPEQVMADAMRGIKAGGYTGPHGADADHLKTPEDIDRTAAAGFTFFTLDPSGDVDPRADDYSYDDLKSMSTRLRDEVDWLDRYRAKRITLTTATTIDLNEEAVMRAIVKYGRAINRAVALANHIDAVHQKMTAAGNPRPYEIELSVDETPQPTTLAEHWIIADQVLTRGMKLVSLAPRFVGDFEKGVDYKGDLHAFEKSLADHVAIMQQLGPYKLSLHSGSDKLSIYPSFARITRGRWHVKTAGTSYLEMLRVVARHEEKLFRDIIEFSRSRYDTDKATYHVSATVGAVPGPRDVKDSRTLERLYLELWEDVKPGRGFTQPGRQILHCTFGSVLTNERFGKEIRQVVEAHPADFTEILREHFVRHLQSLSAGS